jgi:hypothetical protein
VTATAPHRVQLRRIKGFRLPPHTRSVARPHPYGNAHRVGAMAYPVLPGGALAPAEARLTPELAVASHRNELLASPEAARAAREDLRGWNLACFCRLDSPCHVETLLQIANCTESQFTELLIARGCPPPF